MVKFSFGGIVVLVFALCLPLFTYTYGCELWRCVCAVDLGSVREGYFSYSFVFALLMSLMFISANSFVSILNHELIHNLWALLSFSSPKMLQVKAGKGGSFAFAGRKNIMTVLSPYFFPLITLFIFPLYFIISGRYIPYYFIALGLSLGYSVAVGVKQAHYSQPDLQVYGLLPSYLIIIFFQVFILGLVLSFVDGGLGAVLSFITEPAKEAYNMTINYFKDIF